MAESQLNQADFRALLTERFANEKLNEEVQVKTNIIEKEILLCPI